MINKKSIVGIQARDKAIKGALYVADAVTSTIGPFGVNFLLEKGNRITNDGKTISAELVTTIEDEFERRGAYVMDAACAKANDESGDASSTTEALTSAIIRESTKLLPSEKTFAGVKKSVEIKAQIEKERIEVTEKLNAMATMIESEAELIASAKVSVEEDELANLIGKTQWELGPNGIIIPEEHAEEKCEIERVSGIRIDNGFGTSILINNKEKQQLEVNNVRVILCDAVLQDLNPLKAIITQLVGLKNTDIVIVARAFSDQAIQICLENHKNNVRLYPINAPYTNMKEIMLDMAATVGGTYFCSEQMSLDSIQLSDVGFAKKVVARRYDAVFMGTDDEIVKNKTNARADVLRQELAGEPSQFAKKALQSRIAQLTIGFAILKIGASTDEERKYKKDKADDAVNAVRHALQEGVVKGGGLAFKEISDTLPDTYLLKKAIQIVYNQIMTSAPADFVIEDWVRDPVKVLRLALKYACAAASNLINIGGVVTSSNPAVKYVQETKQNNGENE